MTNGNRALKQKIVSTMLHQVWFVLCIATLGLFSGKLPPEYFAMTALGALGVYGVSNYKKHELYYNGNGNAYRTVSTPTEGESDEVVGRI